MFSVVSGGQTDCKLVFEFSVSVETCFVSKYVVSLGGSSMMY